MAALNTDSIEQRLAVNAGLENGPKRVHKWASLLLRLLWNGSDAATKALCAKILDYETDGDASTDNVGLQPEVALLKCETKKGPRFF